MPEIDPAFLALPLHTLADAALGRARELGVEFADFRLERIRTATLSVRDTHLESSTDHEDLGLAVRVVHDGAWGFASGLERTAEAAAALVDRAVATARLSKVLSGDPVVLADEPAHQASWVSLRRIAETPSPPAQSAQVD